MGTLQANSQGELAMCSVTVAAGVPTLTANRGFASIVDNGAGDFTLNLDNAQALNTAGNVQATCGGAIFAAITVEVVTATSIRCRTWDAAGAALDNINFWVRICPVSPQ